jgi:hypothetical protein
LTFNLFYAIILDDMERVWFTSGRGFSVRSILVFVLTVFIAALLWITLSPSPKASAIDGFDASWKGDSLLYDGDSYYAAPPAKAGESHGLPVGTQYYVHVEQIDGAPKIQKAHVIYFAPGADPPTEVIATYINYDYSTENVFTNPQGRQDIDVIPPGEESTYSSCQVDGIGWIICPIAVFLADGMDQIFDLISGFLTVQPSNLSDPNDDLYIAWNIMRSIANVAFIVVFLIIIYSQLTNLAVSNYGLKKLLPRLILAAILVNLSFIITALAVDISNILGYSLQDIFVQIRQDTFKMDNDSWSANTVFWEDVTNFVLSGGALVGGTIAFSIASAGAGGAIYLLLPLLVGLILTVLFVLLILAARQAIIIILIVIAPLAFVAYLLPNTEGWFKKWRDLFMTMLIFFPAFSLVFGGSQLAGGIIMQNATNIFTMIFGLAVQVAPLVITPLLLKLSGGLLGKIAGIVNDPRKGLLDRTKNWSNARAEMHRTRSLGKPGGANPFRRIAQRLDDSASNVKNRTSMYTTENENRYHQTSKYHSLYEGTQGAETEKKRIEAVHERDYKTKVRNSPNLLLKEMDLRTTVDEASESSEQLSRLYEGVRSGVDISTTKNLGALTLRANETTRNLALTAISIQTSKRIQQNQLSDALLKNAVKIDGVKIREWAGITDLSNGAESALTYAVNLKREAEGKLVAERAQLMKHFKLDGALRQQLATGFDVVSPPDSGGNVYTFQASDEYTRDAAIEAQFKTGSFDDQAELIAMSGRGDSAYDFRSTISDSIPANGLPAKALFLGGRFINEVGLGNVSGMKGPNSLTYWAAQSIIGGKIKAEDFANSDASGLKIYLDAAKNGIRDGYVSSGEMPAFTANLRALKQTAALILDPSTDLDRHATQAAKDVLEQIKNL